MSNVAGGEFGFVINDNVIGRPAVYGETAR
jgi:hypothetical protein